MKHFLASTVVESLEPRTLFASTPPVINQTNLVSDGSVPGTTVDTNLVNPWGLANSTIKGIVWISNNGTGTTTFADTSNNTNGNLVVTVAPPAGSSAPATPTGVATNTGKGFVISSGASSAPSIYVYVTEDGTISGWNPNVNLTNTILKVDNSASGAVYKGDAIVKVGSKQFLYVTNFNSGKVEVYDQNFTPVTTMPFTDPSLPTGFAPFNIADIGGKMYVTYAVQDSAKHDDVAGAGNGVVDIFTTKGKFVKRFATGGDLDSPWGMTVAPKTFKSFKNDILVGNFGDGRVNVFSTKGKFVGQLSDTSNQPLTIDGLWALQTGGGLKASANEVFFTAGPDEETHGLFGFLTANK